MSDRTPQTNSAADVQEAMLADLVLAMQRYHRRKRLRRNLGIAIAPACIAASAFAWFMLSPSPQPSRDLLVDRLPDTLPTAGVDDAGRMNVEFVQTDSAILERYAVKAAAPRTIMLDDGALLQTLAQIDRPAGLVRVGDHVWLTRDVVDQSLHDS